LVDHQWLCVVAFDFSDFSESNVYEEVRKLKVVPDNQVSVKSIQVAIQWLIGLPVAFVL